MSKRKAASIMDGMQELHVSPRDKKVKRVSSKEKGELIISRPSASLFRTPEARHQAGCESSEKSGVESRTIWVRKHRPTHRTSELIVMRSRKLSEDFRRSRPTRAFFSLIAKLTGVSLAPLSITPPYVIWLWLFDIYPPGHQHRHPFLECSHASPRRTYHTLHPST